MKLTLFWNPAENRLRAGWRVLLQMLAVSLPMLVLGLTGFYTRPGVDVELLVVLTAVPLTLFVIWFMSRFIDKRAFSDFGVLVRQKRWWAEYGYGWLAGILSASGLVGLLVLVEYVRIAPAARIGLSWLDLLAGIAMSVLIYAGVGFFEELMRVYQVRNLTEGLAPTRLRLIGAVVVAVVISGAYSLVMHIPGRDLYIPYLFYVLVTGSIYGLFYAWTGRAALLMAIHAAWDFTLTNLFALGGAAGAEAALFSVPLIGAGASDNPLFQLLGLAGKVICLVLVLLWVYWREGRVRIRPDIATPHLLSEEEPSPAPLPTGTV